MYRLLNWLFGWQYITFVYGFSHVISRVKTLPNGKKYTMYCGDMFFLDGNKLIDCDGDKFNFWTLTK
jgi:hypothetical protein